MKTQTDQEKYIEYVEERIKINKIPMTMNEWKINYRKVKFIFSFFELDIYVANIPEFLIAVEKICKHYNVGNFDHKHKIEEY